MTTSPSAAQRAEVSVGEDRAEPGRWYTSGPAIVACIALARLALHLLTASRYGYFRDELYFLACGEHLDWGYVDQPPLIGLAAWFVRHFLGESLLALHFLPALSGLALVWLTGLMARELGGKRFGLGLAALGTACATVYLIMHRLFTMNAFEPLFWMGCAYLLMRIINTGNQKLWIWFGLLAGLGLQNKYSMLVFGLAIVVGLLLTPHRRLFANKWLWIGGAVAFLVFLPNVLWNIQHNWPFVEMMRHVKASGRDVEAGPLRFILEQIMLMGPVTLPVWLAGLFFLLFARGGQYRPLGWAFVINLAAWMVLKGKNYYPTPAYPMLFAAGGVAIEEFIARRRQSWLKPALAGLILAGTLALLPIALPVLPVESYLRYQEALPFPLPRSEKGHLRAALPQYYADSFGWEEMAAAVARIYHSLPPEERAKAGIVGNNFGQSGAIDFFGKKYGLPKSIGDRAFSCQGGCEPAPARQCPRVLTTYIRSGYSRQVAEAIEFDCGQVVQEALCGDEEMKGVGKKRIVPVFATEAEEADWWYENQKKLDKDLVDAARAGELKMLDRKALMARVARSKASKVISIRVPERDLELARQQAAKRGLPYQTYIKSLLHEALEEHAQGR